MLMYVVLVTFTNKRMETIKDLPEGLAKARELAKKYGIEFKSVLYMMGQYELASY